MNRYFISQRFSFPPWTK